MFTRPAWYARLIGLRAFVGVHPERLATGALNSCGLFEFTKD